MVRAESTFGALLRQVAAISGLHETEADPPLCDGTVLAGRFVIERAIGRGGMGFVYEAVDREHDCTVALKTLRRRDAELGERLRREFRAMQRVAHPNLIRPVELCFDEGRWFFTMELVRGVDFRTYVGTSHSRLRRALRELCLVLCDLHAAGCVHRDVKPSNILITDEGRVVLLDLGLVRDALEPSWLDRGAAGTPLYMAPEQEGSGGVSSAADWYAVGVIAYECLTGELPFPGPPPLLPAQRAAGPPPLAAGLPADLGALATALLHIDPEARPGAAQILAALGDTSGPRPAAAMAEPVFVGREGDLALLRAALADVRGDRRPRVVWVHGASGIGKTALVGRFAAGVSAEVTVLSGRCHEGESVPFKGVDAIIDRLADRLAELPRDVLDAIRPAQADLLSSMFPSLARLRGFTKSSGPIAPSSSHRRRLTFEALRELFGRLTSRGPVVICVDDAQWADRDALGLFAALLAEPGAPALLVVLASRTSEPPDVGHALVELALQPLTQAEARELVKRISTEDATLDAESLVDDAGGHPLYLSQLARFGTTAGGAVRLSDVIRARAEALDAAARRLLELVAIAGRPVEIGVLREAMGGRGDRLLFDLDATRRGGLITTTGPRGHDTVDTFHDQVRETMLSTLSADAFRRGHLALGSALARLRPDDDERLATHFHQAGLGNRAHDHALAAAESAMSKLAYEHAAALFGLAMKTAPDEARSARARLGRADALAAASRPLAAADEYLAIATKAESDVARRARRRAAEQLLVGGQTERGLALLHGVLEELDLPSPERAQELRERLERQIEATLAGADPIDRHAVVDGIRAERLELLWSAGSALVHVAEPRARDLQSLLLQAAFETGEASWVVRSLALYTCACANVGPIERTERLARRARELLAQTSDPHAESMVKSGEALASFHRGDWQAAKRLLEECQVLLRERTAATSWDISAGQTFLSLIDWCTGDLEALAERRRRGLADAAARGDESFALSIEAVASPLVLLAEGQPEPARQVLEATADRLFTGAEGFVHALHADNRLLWVLHSGSPADIGRLERDPAFARAVSSATRRHYTRITTRFLRGTVALVVGDHATTERAASDLEGEAIPWAEPLSVVLGAQLAHARGDHPRALDELEAAAEAFAERGMKILASAADRAAAVARGEPPAPSAYPELEAALVPLLRKRQR